ncbi:restriction endonuclease subunit S [Synechocystis salina LEGE 06099]|nr:restriction endonuclease subunit S [Synechocystis salina LEGE 06099]
MGLFSTGLSVAVGGKIPLVKHLRVGDVEKLNIPLPPLPEQHRIVARVDALMALCDQLENQIEQQTAKQTQLLSAVMAGV